MAEVQLLKQTQAAAFILIHVVLHVSEHDCNTHTQRSKRISSSTRLPHFPTVLVHIISRQLALYHQYSSLKLSVLQDKVLGRFPTHSYRRVAIFLKTPNISHTHIL